MASSVLSPPDHTNRGPRPRRGDNVRGSVKSFGGLLMASGCMPYIPSFNVGTFVFALAMAAFIIYQLAKFPIRFSNGRDIAAALFVMYGFLSYLTLSYNGYGFPEWSRAMVPFIFFLCLPMLPPLTQPERLWLSKALFLAGMIWLARILGEAAILAFQGSNVLTVRLTYNVINSVIPFPMIIIPYLLFVKNQMRPWLRWGLLAIMVYVYVWIGYRAGLVIISFPIVLYFARRLKSFNILPILLLFLGGYLLIYSGLLEQLKLTERFADLADQSISSRDLEWQYAIDQFRASPIIGKGLGWQVPTSITFYGLEFSELTAVSQVGYVHSVLAYMAMNLGVLGIALYFYIVTPRIYRQDQDGIQLFASVALFILLTFCMTQASFRLIQTVLMMVALIKLNARPVSTNLT